MRGRARRRRQRADHHRRHRPGRAVRARPHPAAAGPDRVRVPGVQPGRRADRGAEHGAAAAAGRRAPQAAAVVQALAEVGLAERAGHYPAQLSGGEQQRVAIARALITRPAVLFADEPTGALDSTSSAVVLAALRRLVDAHLQTVVMVTHDPVAAAAADRVLVLADGRLVDEITGADPARIAARLARGAVAA
ncbi:ABC transporter ATP-binding protein [Catellatospora coxensis]